MVNNVVIKRGQLYWGDLGEQKGSIQAGQRPVLILQNDVGNKHSPTVTICPISSKINKMRLPTHVQLDQGCGLLKPSFALIEQSMTINKESLLYYIGDVNKTTMQKINMACKIQFNIVEEFDITGFIGMCKLQNKKNVDILTKKLVQYCINSGIGYKVV